MTIVVSLTIPNNKRKLIELKNQCDSLESVIRSIKEVRQQVNQLLTEIIDNEGTTTGNNKSFGIDEEEEEDDEEEDDKDNDDNSGFSPKKKYKKI